MYNYLRGGLVMSGGRCCNSPVVNSNSPPRICTGDADPPPPIDEGTLGSRITSMSREEATEIFPGRDLTASSNYGRG